MKNPILLESIKLIDVYETETERTKTYRLAFRAMDRTLTGSEVNEMVERLKEKLILGGCKIK